MTKSCISIEAVGMGILKRVYLTMENEGIALHIIVNSSVYKFKTQLILNNTKNKLTQRVFYTSSYHIYLLSDMYLYWLDQQNDLCTQSDQCFHCVAQRLNEPLATLSVHMPISPLFVHMPNIVGRICHCVVFLMHWCICMRNVISHSIQ